MGGTLSDVPPETTGFVGRERELSDVRDALARTRLVTLTGPGGVGKSRLALRTAHEVGGRFPDGVCMVELSGVRDPNLLADTVAEAMGVRDGSAPSAVGLLTRALRGKRFLLILDTCEHLVPACAALVRSLLVDCPGLRVLATGRQQLGVAREAVLEVPPLAVPEVTDPPGDGPPAAVELFARRAAEAVPGFTLTDEVLPDVALLCRRLDGIPLAIELAAAQLRSLPLERLVRRVDGLFWTLESAGAEDVRHQTLRTTVGWSHELCAPLERLLWARLSVFAGGFDLAMAVEVCGDDRLDPDGVAACLAGLAEKSIVQRVAGDRYDMLDTLREYGAVWLERVEDVRPLLVRHRDCLARLARRAAAAWMTDGQLSWVRRMDTERDNLRAALEFCFTVPGEARAGLAMAGALWRTWLCRSRFTEGRYWLDRGLRLVSEPGPESAEALWQTAYLRTNQGDSPEALPMIGESLKYFERTGDTAGYARAQRTLGAAATFMGDTGRADAAFDEALRIMTGQDLLPDLVMLRVLRGFHRSRSGDPERALAECDEALLLLKDAPTESWIRSWVGYVKALAYWFMDDGGRCAAELRAGLEMFRRMEDPAGLTNCFEMLGWLSARAHRHEEAAVLLGAASRYPEKVGVPRLGAPELEEAHRELEDRVRAELGSRRFAELHGLGMGLDVDEAVRLALGEAPPDDPPG
ncbi:tetratricopeptide repeat protein [Spirillospora sp. NPDC029432]|uniref:ATP-binding protein n=1 Tax=Spirillospora sp. NPDC029432 TaxID=3154599 RepID=UPI0034546280